MNRLLLAALLLSGCGGHTSLLLDLSLASGVVQPATLRATLYGQGVVGSPQVVPLASAGRVLPGRLVVRPLEPSLPDPRIEIDGLDAQGMLLAQAVARVQLAAGQQTEVALVLDHALADSDRDGVPDAIDDCPTLADADQRCGAGADGGADLSAFDGSADLRRGPSCPTPNLLCDDFETGNASKWSQTVVKANTTLTIHGPQTFGGSFALDVLAQPNPTDMNTFASESASLNLSLLPTGLDTLAARLYVRAPAFPGAYALFLGLFENTNGWAVGVDGNGNWVVTQDQSNLADLNTSVPMPLDAWVCVELIVDPPGVSQPMGHLRLKADGVTILDVTPGSFTTPTLLSVGLVRAPGNTTSHVFIDDVVLANQPIGCE